jgi:DNA repair exonuclease SbcCD ATPase subunit
VEQLRKALEAERAARQRLEELRRVALKDAEHSAIERRKTQTRMRNLKARIKNGICPCCKRSFVQLARHMATKHPEYGDAHEPQQG